MAYASKYYDPKKAHEYYMRTRELIGYENRYGGSRGDGTSAASTGRTYNNDASSHNTSVSVNKQIQNKISYDRTETQAQIQDLRDKLNNMSKEQRKANRQAIMDQINALREKNQYSAQLLREQITGGSTSGFNQKGKEAAMYIKNQMEQERDDIINKTNKDCDKAMLDSVKRLADDVKKMRDSGNKINNKEILARIKALTGETKKQKLLAKRKYTAEYKQKCKDEIDKLRRDKSMYTYYDKQAEKLTSLSDNSKLTFEVTDKQTGKVVNTSKKTMSNAKNKSAKKISTKIASKGTKSTIKSKSKLTNR